MKNILLAVIWGITGFLIIYGALFIESQVNAKKPEVSYTPSTHNVLIDSTGWDGVQVNSAPTRTDSTFWNGVQTQGLYRPRLMAHHTPAQVIVDTSDNMRMRMLIRQNRELLRAMDKLNASLGKLNEELQKQANTIELK